MLRNEHRIQHLDHAHTPRDFDASIMRRLSPRLEGVAHRKPSKLELMRADYQKKLLKQKEEKMIQMYEESQRKVMMRMARNGGRNVQTPAGPTAGRNPAREQMSESRQAETSITSPADSNYRRTKSTSSPAELSGKDGRGSCVKAQKTSAGRDRSQPLAPIRRPKDTLEMANSSNRSGLPQKMPVSSTAHGNDNPFLGKPRLVKHKPLPPTNGHYHDNRNSGGSGEPQATQSPSSVNRFVSSKPPQAQQHQKRLTTTRKPRAGVEGERSESQGRGKLTDFQQWQAEQNKAREDRLNKLNIRGTISNDKDGSWRHSGDDHADEGDNLEAGDGKGVDIVGADNIDDDDIKAKEKELIEKIAHRQKELEKIRKEKEKVVEEERRQLEQQKKKEMKERLRQKKFEEERKEEEERLKQEESENQFRRQRESNKGKEDDKRRKEEDKRRQDAERSLQKEDKVTPANEDKMYSKSTSDIAEHSTQSPVKRSSNVPKKSEDPQPSRSRVDSADLNERRLSVSDSTVYEQAAASYDAQVTLGKLAQCVICGRSFIEDRLKKHQEACAKANKPRKEFDSAKKRVEGTDLAKYAGKAKRPEPPKRKSNWRAQHEEFIQSLRYAKKVIKCEKEGGDLRKLTPPPSSENPDYVPCPHCGRTFNENAAERHIPRCQALKTRPLPMNTRRK